MTEFFTPKKKRFFVYISAALLALLFTLDQIFHWHVQDTFLIVGISITAITVTVLMILTWVATFKILLNVATGLSLILFLAQSYCSTANHTANGENALKTLIVIGFSYLLYIFVTELYLALTVNQQDLLKEADKIQKAIVRVITFLSAALFVFIIYEVVHPIVLDLCVFK